MLSVGCQRGPEFLLRRRFYAESASSCSLACFAPIVSAPFVSDSSIPNECNHCRLNPQSPPLLTHKSWRHLHTSRTPTGLGLWNWIWCSCKTLQSCVFSVPFYESEQEIVVVQGHVIFLARWVSSSAMAGGAKLLSFWSLKKLHNDGARWCPQTKRAVCFPFYLAGERSYSR